MSRYLPIALALVAIVTCGVVEGLQTDRWGINSELAESAVRLDQIPKVIGDWTGTDQEMDPQQLRVAGALGHVARVYVNRVDGRSVTIVVLCGRPGPMSVHPPTVCLTGAGWSLVSPQQKRGFQADDQSQLGEFWQGNFARDNAGVPVQIRTLWSWSTSGNWQAVASARRTFAGEPKLYKLYVTYGLSDRVESGTSDRVDEFLKLFLPSLKSVVGV